jgi:hypothetical protein
MIRRKCAICGSENPIHGSWFLIIENSWADRVRIIPWDICLAGQPEILMACSAAHTCDILHQWVALGSLTTTPELTPHLPYPKEYLAQDANIGSDSLFLHAWNLAGSSQPVELAVCRRSLQLNPELTKSVLDAVLRALQNEPSYASAREANILCSIPQDISNHSSLLSS